MEKKSRKTPINPDIVQLGKRIGEIIQAKGLKTREVAHDADLDVENLRKYLKGKQEMKVTTMLKISKSLRVSVAEMFDFINND